MVFMLASDIQVYGDRNVHEGFSVFVSKIPCHALQSYLNSFLHIIQTQVCLLE